MRRWVLVACAAALAFGVWTTLSALRLARELEGVGSVLAASGGRLDVDDLARGRERLEAVRGRVRGFPLAAARLLPVASQNLRTIDVAATRTIPVIDASIRARRALDEIGAAGVVAGGEVQLDLVATLERPLADVAGTLARLEDALRDELSGWLLPVVWDELDRRIRTIDRLARDAGAAADAVRVANDVLGADEKRTYLVMFVNPAEARAAGGVVSGLGSISFDDGRVRLGRFRHAPQIGRRPYRRVPAPPDLRRRFARYGSDTTLLVNATMSPDVPEAAITVARAFRTLTGVATDGAIVADARGIAALIPTDESIRVPGTDTRLSRSELPGYVYSRSYADLARPSRRHDALIRVGEAAFEAALGGGGGYEWLRGIARAAGGGHLRFVSFDANERAALAGAGIDGSLRPPEGDALFVTTQNLGGDKLDFWIDRSLRHACAISPGTATCRSEVELRNTAPRDLPGYVTQRKGRALAETFLEIYVPATAVPTNLLLDGAPIGFARDREDGYVAIGVHLELARTETATLQLDYSLPLEEAHYLLSVWPQQPLARPASVHVELTAPRGWRLYGPEGASAGELEFEDRLDAPLLFEAEDRDKPGLAAAWDALVRFWREPVFAALL